MSWLDTIRLGYELVKDLVTTLRRGANQPFRKPNDTRRFEIEDEFHERLNDREDDRGERN